jgi:hypothetical protein
VVTAGEHSGGKAAGEKDDPKARRLGEADNNRNLMVKGFGISLLRCARPFFFGTEGKRVWFIPETKFTPGAIIFEITKERKCPSLLTKQ